MGHGSCVEGSLLYFADYRGHFDVFGFENDAGDNNGCATSTNDEDHATYHGGHVCNFPVFERLGVVYSHQQSGGYRAAMVLEPDTPPTSPGKASAQQKVSADICCGSTIKVLGSGMTKELVRDGKLDREAAAEALREFLQKIVGAGKFELNVKVRTAEVTAGSEGDAEVFADLDGKDREILLARGAELLKALEHMAFRALRLEPAFHEKIHLDCGGYRALRFEELKMTARVAAERVQTSKQPFQLNPMSSRERRIVHLALKDMPGVRTESVGMGEDRQVVIHPVKSESGAKR